MTVSKIAPFHVECLTTGKACEDCTAEAARSKHDGEDITGYLNCVAMSAR